MSISVEPTTTCNLQCRECPAGLKQLKRPQGNMDIKTFQRIINDNYRHLSYLILYFQGEPFLNPSFFEMIRISVSKKIYSVSSTNGHFLDKLNSEKIIKSGLDKLIISLDGTDQKSYAEYRKGGDYNTVITGIKNLTESKQINKSNKPFIEIQFLVTGYNEHQIEDMKKLAESLNINKLTFKTIQIYDVDKNSDLLPENPKYTRYKKDPSGKYIIKNKLKNKCWRMWSSAVITWDGTVVPCCFDKDAKYNFGNLTDISLTEIWKNNSYLNFRGKIMISRAEIDICSNCTEGLI